MGFFMPVIGAMLLIVIASVLSALIVYTVLSVPNNALSFIILLIMMFIFLCVLRAINLFLS